MLRAIPTPLLPSRGTNPADICEIPWMCPRSPLSPGCESAARPGGPALLRGWGSAQPRRRQRGSPGLGGGFLVGARCLLASLHEGIPLPGASGSPHPPRPIGAAADVEPPQCPHVEGTRVGGGLWYPAHARHCCFPRQQLPLLLAQPFTSARVQQCRRNTQRIPLGLPIFAILFAESRLGQQRWP